MGLTRKPKSHCKPHITVPIKVWVGVDVGIAEDVIWLNSLPGVRTYACCQGTLSEGGPNPYPPFVMAWWPKQWNKLIRSRFRIGERGKNWAYLHPKD